MHRYSCRIPAFLLALTLMAGLLSHAHAAVTAPSLSAAIQDTADYLYRTVEAPQVGSVGGEWAVLGLARSGCAIPDEYYQGYYAAVEQYVDACRGNLHDKKYTEYSRLVLTLTAIGKNPRQVAGYDLLAPLGDYEKTVSQGLNGPVWALIALDSGNYEMPQNPTAQTQATRQMYLDRILEYQLPDGGFSLFGGSSAASSGLVSNPDITGMALQALSAYQDQPAVAKVTQEALSFLSDAQDDNGGYASWDSSNSESVVQVIVALCALGIPLDDPRFVKQGHTLLDNLMCFYRPGNGFLHTGAGDGSSQMATEQALYGLVASQRLAQQKPALYRMTDHLTIPDGSDNGPKRGTGLAGKSPAVTPRPIVAPGKQFPDLSENPSHPNLPAIEALAARGIIDGKSDGRFDPNAEMTRAEFAAIMVKALGLPTQGSGSFSDVPAQAWYAPYVASSSAWGIVNGSGDGTFRPLAPLSRQEAAVMVTNAAQLCGLDPSMDNAATRDTLSQFLDYTTSAPWARPSLAFCYREHILDRSELYVRPGEAVMRAEVAQMLFNLLSRANLL